jgi:hypothetical protein
MRMQRIGMVPESGQEKQGAEAAGYLWTVVTPGWHSLTTRTTPSS